MTTPFVEANGARVPAIGLGTWDLRERTCVRMVEQALRLGYRMIDTAEMYGNEREVGEGLRSSGVPRDQVFVTTKVWPDHLAPREFERATKESLAKLKLSEVDLLLIHWPNPLLNRYVESWKAFVRLQKDGRVRSIGVSNFNRDHVERIIGETGVTPAVNQIELHPRFQQRALRAFHDEKGVKTESWSPLGRGGLMSEPAIVDIADKHRKTPAQVVIRWHLDSGLIVIPKTVRLERLKENIGAFAFQLDENDMRRLEMLDSPDGRIGPNPATATF